MAVKPPVSEKIINAELTVSEDIGVAADAKQPFFKCRYIIAFIGFWCFFLPTFFRLNLSIGIVAMVNHTAIVEAAEVKSDSCPLLTSNSTQAGNPRNVDEEGEFLWSPSIQGYILGSYYFAYTIAQIPAGRIADAYGCKWLIFAVGFVTGLGTFFIPVLASVSVEGLIAVQFIRGLAQGFLLPAASVLVTNWFPRAERGHMLTLMMSGSPIGCCVSSLLSGFLCASSAKWPSSFYVTGAVGIFISLLVIFFVHESPEVHPRISKAELNFILKKCGPKLTKEKPNTPWCKIFTSVPVYALLCASFGVGWGFAQYTISYTIFMGTILHYPIAANGSFTALVFLFKFISINVGSYFSSVMITKKIASINFTRKFWTFLFALGYSASMVGFCLVGCNRTLSILFAVLSIGFTGVGFAGSVVSIPNMCPNFVGMLTGISTFISLVPGVVLPLLIGYMTDEKQTLEQWNKVSYVGIAVILSSGIIYSLFGSADVQPWNSVQEKEEPSESKTQF